MASLIWEREAEKKKAVPVLAKLHFFTVLVTACQPILYMQVLF